jgi:hypothetical protein
LVLLTKCGPGGSVGAAHPGGSRGEAGKSQNELAARKGFPFDEGVVISKERGADLIALNEALERLATIDVRKSQ